MRPGRTPARSSTSSWAAGCWSATSRCARRCLGLFGKRNLYGPIPIEIGAFFDAGVAWDSGSKPSMFGGERQLVKSTGASRA